MGQYYIICNLDKRQYLHPHKFGDGLKLLEFGCSAEGILTGLTYLLADGNGRGGGDITPIGDLSGSWVGDRVVIAGDYADNHFIPLVLDYETLFHYAMDFYEDISDQVIEEITSKTGSLTALSTINRKETGWRTRTHKAY